MKFISTFSALLLIYFLSISCVNGADLESANEMYVKSGLEKQVQDIGPALLASYTNNYNKSDWHTGHDKKIYQRIGQVINDSFDTQTMRGKIVNGLAQDISSSDMEMILAWLSSSVGRKITELEKKAGSKEGVKETQAYIKNIKKSQLSAERISLIKDLNSSMNVTETTVNVALSTQFALSIATRTAKKKLSRDDVRKLYEDFTTNSSQIEPMIKHQVHGSLLYTYQELTDEELVKFVTFAQSKSGKNYTSVTSSYLLQAIIESSLQLAWEISQS